MKSRLRRNVASDWPASLTMKWVQFLSLNSHVQIFDGIFEEFANRVLRRLETEVSQEERLRRGLLLYREDLLRGLSMTGVL